MKFAALLLFLAAPARAIPDDIWKHINTACTAGQSVVKNNGASWSCGQPQDVTSWTHSDIYAATSSVRTTSAGDFVGIGTLTPVYPLDVHGAIHGTSTMTATYFSGSGAGLTNLSVDFSTITAALALKHGLTITTSEIDLSTVTAALATKASTGTDNSMTRADALATLGAAVVAVTTITASGQLNVGWELITNNCGAGVTTCTATCSSGKVVTGCGNCSVAAVAGLSVDTGGSATSSSCTCTALTATTISSYAYCARMGN